jgi:hypothetical protein
MQGRPNLDHVVTTMRAVSCAMLVLLAAGPAAAQQEQRRAPTPVDVEQLPISVDRIEDDLSTPPAISLESTQPLFRVEIVAPRQRWLGEIDWLGATERAGPIVPVPSLHDQYLARVTPPEARMFGAFEGAELFQVMVTSLIQGLAARKVADKVKEAARKRREEAAQREVDEAIARWRDGLERDRKENEEGRTKKDEGRTKTEAVTP